MVPFRITVVDNVRTWGPDAKNEQMVNVCIPQLKKYQFEPSMRFERIGRVCDFTYNVHHKGTRESSRGATNTEDAVEPEELEFQTVDIRPLPKNKGGLFTKKKSHQTITTEAFTQKQQEEDALYSGKVKSAEQKKQKMLQQAKRARINARHRLFTEWSIEPTPHWQVEAEMLFNDLQKKIINVDQLKMEDILFKGKVYYYDKKIDNINAKTPPNLLNTISDADCFTTTTKDDKTIMNLIEKEEEKEKNPKEEEKKKNPKEESTLIIAATDLLISFLMTAIQSKYSWHLLIRKKGNTVIFDKDEESIVDLLTVNENSADAPSYECENKINSLHALGLEAIKINQKFRKQVLLKEVAEEYETDTFKNTDNNASLYTVYRYRKILLPPLTYSSNKKTYTIITRGEAHSKNKGNNNSYIYVCTFNEYDIKSHKNWRSQIENQKGALLANEIKNNTTKLQKFICQALLSGCDDFKLGFISRKLLNDNEHHCILAIQSHKTKDLSTQIGLKYENVWGIVRYVADILATKQDGKYVLLKDPMKPLLRLYCTSGEDIARF